MPRKRRNLEWTEKAERDLELIHAFIAKDKPIAAIRFVARIKRAVENLIRFPYMGEILTREEESQIREIYVKTCRVVFRVRVDAIRVITLVHSARDFHLDEIGDLE
jgi:toxin ParE1/3/4